MTITLQPMGEDRGRDRKRRGLVLLLLLLLFLAALGAFILLISRGGAPRVSLPEVLGIATGGKPKFDRTVASVARPIGVALSPDGSKIYAIESYGSYAIKVFDSKGKPLADAVPPHTTEGTRQPMAIAAAPDGSVYVTDRVLRQVLIFNADGTFREVFRPVGFGDWAPLGIAVDKAGLVYVSDTLDIPGQPQTPESPGTPAIERHRVYVFNPDGTLVRWFGQKGAGAKELMFPEHLAIDGKGRIWVGDVTGVKVFDSDGNYAFRLGAEGDAGTSLPGGLAYADGRMYVTDVTNHRGIVLDVSGDAPVFKAQFGEMGFGNGQFKFPAGIAASASRIYIANRENGRIDTWTK
jgi:DNA-binding beta-propeller fold protein YncE